MTWLRAHWAWALGGMVVLVAAFAAGRFAAPTKVETKEVVREVKVVDEKVVEERLASARTEWEKRVKDNSRIEIRYKDGKVVERIVYVDREVDSGKVRVETKIEYVDREKIVYQVKEVTVEKLVERDCPRVTFLGSVGMGFSAGGVSPPVYGAEATARVLGPLAVGLGGEGNAQGGAARVLFGAQF